MSSYARVGATALGRAGGVLERGGGRAARPRPCGPKVSSKQGIMPRPTFVPANRAQARVVAAAAEVGAEKRGLQVAAPRRGASCASPMRYIAPREDSCASVASKYVRARSATPLVRRTLQNPDARISLTFAATVVATANTELWDLDGPRRQVKEDTPAPSRRARTRALRLKPSAAPRRRLGAATPRDRAKGGDRRS